MPNGRGRLHVERQLSSEAAISWGPPTESLERGRVTTRRPPPAISIANEGAEKLSRTRARGISASPEGWTVRVRDSGGTVGGIVMEINDPNELVDRWDFIRRRRDFRPASVWYVPGKWFTRPCRGGLGNPTSGKMPWAPYPTGRTGDCERIENLMKTGREKLACPLLPIGQGE